MTHTFITLSPATAATLMWTLAITLACYLAVVVAVFIDLRSAILKARHRGIARTSRGYRRTVAKAGRYLTTLLALTAVDALLVLTAIMLRSTMGWILPALPLFTIIGAVAMTLIEAKSVVENTQDSRRYRHALRSLSRALDSDELQHLVERLRALAKEVK
ncbi:MAG: hypothetical protein K2K79_01085 [Paramuribaculum sp.]|nr:hypothetical protein [Paramuribaculum sp.]